MISSNRWFGLYIHDTVRKSEPKNCTKWKRMVTRHLEQKTREKTFATRDRLTSLFLQPKEKGRRRTRKIAIYGSPKVNVPEDKIVSF